MVYTQYKCVLNNEIALDHITLTQITKWPVIRLINQPSFSVRTIMLNNKIALDHKTLTLNNKLQNSFLYY